MSLPECPHRIEYIQVECGFNIPDTMHTIVLCETLLCREFCPEGWR